VRIIHIERKQIHNISKLVFFSLFASIMYFSVVSAVDFNISDVNARYEYIKSIPRTIWPPQDSKRPMTYNEWKSITTIYGPLDAQILLEKHTALKGDPVKFDIFVNTDLYPDIETSVDQYISDLTNDGYDVKLISMTGGTPAQFRQYLQNEYAEGMAGCILIGDLPVPWYETNCWDEDVSFPCDLYYMDLDGIWDDIDSDGQWDGHSGDRTPEIWLGRLTASPMTLTGASEAELVNNYFTKNHLFRTGQSFLYNRGLVFIDDDWEPFAADWGGAVGNVYDSLVTYASSGATIDANYESELANNFESVLLCAHSSPNCHYFKIGDQWTGGTTCNYEIVAMDPVAHFYNLFACSNARYVEYDYMSGWYIFCNTYGLASLGSTKTGSMLYFEYFYGPFGNGRTFGEAFYDWFTVVNSWVPNQEDLCWFYGMTLCGDPTLKHTDPGAVTITKEIIKSGMVNQPYTDTLAAEGGTPPYIWTLTSGQLPQGLNLDGESGIISGIPAAVQLSEFSVRVTDAFVPPAVDTKSYTIEVSLICGDADGSGAVNILDVTYVVAYLYTGGPAPEPYNIGDANGSGAVNILDVTYIINYLYKSGPAPNCE